jgi:hypothetical protein
VVSVESIEHWYSYDETSTSIREFLKDAYWTWGLTYCLLIGDPDPYDRSDSSDYSGSVPMKMTWLDGSWDTDQDYPTDFYYAELTGDWDSELMYDSSVASLGDSAPSFVNAISCSNAKQETDDNITHELIKDQSVSVIAASRSTVYIEGKTSFCDDIDGGSIGYHIAANHADQDPAGVSMSLYRWNLFEGDAGGGNWKSRNLMAYNLYGDPSLEFHF